ncbi:MAG: cupin domain-containing protein [Dysgonamonadaceae bacterium]|nr:cupin domain-containing protein [Dysgonamonadaceae bacterium]
MQNNQIFFESDFTELIDLGAGCSRQIMGYDDNVMLVKASFETGGIGAIHEHPHVQTSYVATGKFEVTVDGDKRILSAGDGFFVPSGKQHGVVCLEAGILIDVFHPVRKDFLKV